MATKYWYNLNAMLIGALKLKPLEMIVFRWLIGFMHSGAMKQVRKETVEYYWVSLPKLVADLSFATLKTEQHARRILQSLCTKKVLYYALHDNNKAYYALTQNGEDLVKHFKKRHRKFESPQPDPKHNFKPAGQFTKPDAHSSKSILKGMGIKWPKP